LIEMQNHLGIRFRAQLAAARLQTLAQLQIVEDLTVEADPDGAIGIGHGLLTGGDIDDAEPRMAEPDALLGKKAEIVRAAMGNGANHAAQQRAWRAEEVRPSEIAGDAAHELIPAPIRPWRLVPRQH